MPNSSLQTGHNDARARLRAALTVPSFRILWLAEIVNLIGDQLAKIALAVVVYQRTHSPLVSALAYATPQLATLIGGITLGWVADRFDRRAVMVGCACAQAATLALMAALPTLPVAALLSLLVVASLLQCPFAAAQNALVPTLLSGPAYHAGHALRHASMNAVTLIGLLGGGLAVAATGPSWALAADAASFAATALVLHRGLPRNPPPATASTTTHRTSTPVRSGLAATFGHPPARTLMLLMWLAGIPAAAGGLMPAFTTQAGHPEAVAWVLAADAAAYTTLTLALHRLALPTRQRIIGILAVASVLPLAGFAFSPDIPGAALLLAISGGAAVYQVTAGSTFMTLIPDAHRGSAYSIARTGLRATQGLGAGLAGALAEGLHSIPATIASAGAVGVVAAAALTWSWHRCLRSPLPEGAVGT